MEEKRKKDALPKTVARGQKEEREESSVVVVWWDGRNWTLNSQRALNNLAY
jgi:hypothetical protein